MFHQFRFEVPPTQLQVILRGRHIRKYKQDQVTVSVGADVLAQQLSFGSVTPYMTVRPGTQTVQFSASGQKTDMSVALAAGSVHTIVVLDGSAGLKVGALTDAAGSAKAPMGGAATGLGGTAPPPPHR